MTGTTTCRKKRPRSPHGQSFSKPRRPITSRTLAPGAPDAAARVAGRVTYRHGRHASTAAGGWVRELRIAPRTWRALAAVIRRPLTQREREGIAEALSLHAHFLDDAQALTVSAQSQKRTLAAVAALPLEEIAHAFARMDERSHLRIVNELHQAGARTADELARPAPEALQAAAVAALANWQPLRGGRPGRYRWRGLALCVCRLWRTLTGAGRAPPSKFAAILFPVAGADLKTAQLSEVIEAASRDLRALPRLRGRAAAAAEIVPARGTIYRMGKVYRKF